MTLIRTKNTALALLAAAAVIFAPVTATAASYTIKGGDYLDRIARTHGTTWQKLHEVNPSIKDANRIYPGTQLVIPEAGQAAAPAPVTASALQPAAAPTPAPTPAPQPVSAGLTGCELARSLINQYDWNTDVAYQVMMAESHCDPNATNMADDHGACSGSFGLFQINCTRGQLYDPAANVAAAYAMYQQSGWQPWGATTCAVKVACN
jgi:LysM repeat protein